MKSLFVASMPCSLSSLVYHASRLALQLEEPVWTTDGEILNTDRFTFYQGPTQDTGAKYVDASWEPELVQQVVSFLDDVARPTGRAYKDVVQPFAASAWLPASGLRVLRIRRPVADVAYALQMRQLTYPARAAVGHEQLTGEELEVAVVDGLLLAERALKSLPGEAVEYDLLIRDEDVLRNALQRLYPEARVRGFTFIDDGFIRVRSAVAARRDLGAYKRVEVMVRRRREKIGS